MDIELKYKPKSIYNKYIIEIIKGSFWSHLKKCFVFGFYERFGYEYYILGQIQEHISVLNT